MQMGVISPSKLRMKLLGVHNSRRKNVGSNSSRTSPNSSSKLEEIEHANNHLLLTCDADDQSSSEQYCSVLGSNPAPASVDYKSVELAASSRSQNITCGSSSTVHPVRPAEEDANGYDSGSTSSFEFYKGERSACHPPAAGPFSRHVPSKWNDAEKWISNRQALTKNHAQHCLQGGRQMHHSNWARNVPEMIPQCLQPKLVSANKMSDELAMADQGVLEKEEDQKAFISERPMSAVPPGIIN